MTMINALEKAAEMKGFTLAEAVAAGVALPVRPSRAGWADRWAAIAHQKVKEARYRAAMAAANARWHKENEEKAAQKEEPSWFIEEQRGQASFSNCLFGFRPVYRPGQRGGRPWAEVERECEHLRALAETKIKSDTQFFRAVMHG